MGRLRILVKGELDRLNKYGLFKATFVVMLFWLAAAWFMEAEVLEIFVPVIFLLEATMMTILLAGATLFYEKKEHTVNSIIVTPVTEREYLFAKIAVNIINSIIAVVVISAGLYFMKGMTFDYIVLVPAMILVTIVHTLIGIKLAYHSNDFTSMLVNYFFFVIAFILPTILAALDIIKGLAADLLFLLPPDASNIILGAAFREVETWRLLAAYGYLIVLTVVIYRFLVKPGLNDYIMRETGV